MVRGGEEQPEGAAVEIFTCPTSGLEVCVGSPVGASNFFSALPSLIAVHSSFSTEQRPYPRGAGATASDVRGACSRRRLGLCCVVFLVVSSVSMSVS